MPSLRIALTAAVVLALGTATACSEGNKPATRSAATISASPSRRLPTPDGAWLVEIHQVDLAEVMVGELAAKKGTTKAVRSAGVTLVDDHTQMERKVEATARNLGVSLPSSVTAKQSTVADRLGEEHGQAFDNDFVATAATIHEKLAADTRTEVAHGASPPIAALAKKLLPVMREHLTMIHEVH